MERIAKVDQIYGTDQRLIRAGERFDVEPQDVPLLLLLGRLEDEEPKQHYRTREMKRRA
jgi:hypothetical protein